MSEEGGPPLAHEIEPVNSVHHVDGVAELLLGPRTPLARAMWARRRSGGRAHLAKFGVLVQAFHVLGVLQDSTFRARHLLLDDEEESYSAVAIKRWYSAVDFALARCHSFTSLERDGHVLPNSAGPLPEAVDVLLSDAGCVQIQKIVDHLKRANGTRRFVHLDELIVLAASEDPPWLSDDQFGALRLTSVMGKEKWGSFPRGLHARIKLAR
jgi:hypothetical protein